MTQHIAAADVAAFFAPAKEESGPRVAGTKVSTELFQARHEKDNLNWATQLLDGIEQHAAGSLFKEYQYRLKKYKPRSANIWLRKMVEKIQEHAARFPLPLRMIANEASRANIAREWANAVVNIILTMTDQHTKKVNADELLNAAMEPARKWGISPLLPTFKNVCPIEGFSDRDLDVAAAALARLQDEDWWERQITKAWNRYTEHVAIIVGKVRRGVSPYVSYKAKQEHVARRRAGALWVQGMYAVNEELNLEIPLAEAVKSSMANPELRRLELMMRMRGFEEVAEEHGLAGEFYTVTAPSRYHAWTVTKQKKTVENPRYDGSHPRDAQAHLCRQWAKARAKLARMGVRFFGFRVVEPHHDGTPHWHMLLFVRPEQRRLLRWVLRKYACEHDKDELARSYKPRFDWVAIDPTKGSATGYIAKYIAKNIDGFSVGIDEETGTAAEETATNVAAWASRWNVRQFQQIGGPSVTVWRELRRLREATQNPILEPARRAADNGKWADFVNTMGGIDVQRKDHAIQLRHLIKAGASKYGEDVTRLHGLSTTDITLSVNGVTTGVMVGVSDVQTRHQGWELSRTGLGSSSGGSRAPWSSDNNCTGDQILAEKDPLKRELALLGLDETDLARLQTGAVITMDGLFISIRNGCLNTSRQRPGMNPPGRQERAAGYRAEAMKLLRSGQDLEPWLAKIPEQYQQLALDQAAALIEQMEDEASWLESAAPKFHEDDFTNWMNDLCHGSDQP
ncbi:replication endonuclease [Oceanimonas sp. AH20CE76]|uniref:replication endonuclease n=1 Tax=Oceanimonas sp. AH20CE76 TaxID=2977120 RepID=UPI0031FF3A1E